MARLAIRATGDMGRRESVTVGHDTIQVNVYSGNTHTFTILVCGDGKQVNVYDETSVYMYEGGQTYETIHFIHAKSETHRA